MQILQIERPEDIKETLRNIRVDPYGIKIMLPKTITYLLKANRISNIAANILKQEMLSLGADVAVARGALTGKLKTTDCLLMGNLCQFQRLLHKLNKQPFGLDKFSQALSSALRNYQKNKFILNLGRWKLNLGRRAFIMGVVNLTPDSFSQDGLSNLGPDHILAYVERLIKDGADIIDLGGESSRPGAKPLSMAEESKRVIPVIKILAKRIKVPISVDTYKPEVAKQALDNGACLVNDVTGLGNPRMIKVITRYKASVVIMHMQGMPFNMQKNPRYLSLIDEVITYLRRAIYRAESSGIEKEKIIIDPGIGFGKLAEHNFQILKRLKEFKVLGKPILVGTSRKSFIGKILNVGPLERLQGTVASCVLAAQNGARILRVHDVKEVKQALRVCEAINNN